MKTQNGQPLSKMNFLLWPAVFMAGAVYVWWRQPEPNLDESCFYYMPETVPVSRPRALQLMTEDPDATALSLSQLGATVRDKLCDSVTVAWDQDLFIRLCDQSVKAQTGVLSLSAVHG